MAQRQVISFTTTNTDRDGNQRRPQWIHRLRTVSIDKSFGVQRNELGFSRSLDSVREPFKGIDRYVIEDLFWLFLDRRLHSHVPGKGVELQLNEEVSQPLVVRVLDP